MSNDNIKNLIEIGLSEGEAKVYVSLSKLGASTVGPIVKSSNVAYSNIYEILNRLLEKGLVSFITKSKTKHYQAASPRNLVDYLAKKEQQLKNQQDTLQSILPQIESIQQTVSKAEAQVFIGLKGLRTAYEHFLVREKKSEYLFFYIQKERYEKKSDLFYLSIRDLWSKVPSRGLTNQLGKKSPSFKKVKQLQLRVADFPIPGNIEVCNDRVLLISWEETITAILIESKDLANNYRRYFNTVWEKAKE